MNTGLVPRLYPCARTQTNRFRCISDWSEYEHKGKAWERGYRNTVHCVFVVWETVMKIGEHNTVLTLYQP